MKPPNSFVSILTLWIILFFVACHSGNTSDKAVAIQKIEPPLLVPYFKRSDTLVRTIPADTAVYSILNALLSNRGIFENTKTTRFCNESHPDTGFSAYFDELLNKKIISSADTIGVTSRSTKRFRFDWGKADGRNGIALKELIHDFDKLIQSGAMGSGSFSLQRKSFVDCFHCDAIVCVSYPRVNRSGDLAIIEMSESLYVGSGGGNLYILKKSGGKWKLIDKQGIWAS
jgi:hypothetical protein